jgi:hypothetical protein
MSINLTSEEEGYGVRRPQTPASSNDTLSASAEKLPKISWIFFSVSKKRLTNLDQQLVVLNSLYYRLAIFA